MLVHHEDYTLLIDITLNNVTSPNLQIQVKFRDQDHFIYLSLLIF